MAFVKDGEDNNKPKQNAQPEQPQGNPAGGEKRRPRRSIFEVDRMHPRSISRSQLGEVVARWREVTEAVVKNPTINSRASDHSILVFNGETNNTPFSCLVHVTKSPEGAKIATYHTLLIEGSAEPLQPELKRVNQTEIEIIRTAADAFDNTMAEKIHTLVADSLPDFQLYSSDYTVISSENKPTEDSAKGILFFSGAANEAILDRVEGAELFSIREGYDPDQEKLRGRLEYDPEPLENVNGLPVRSDIHIGVTAHSRSNSGQTKRLTEVDCYVDLVLDQESMMAAGNQFGGAPMQNQFGPQQQMPNTQRYYPRAVLTRADNYLNMISLETELLALTTVAQLARNSAYSGVWRPRKGLKQKEDLRDIGAVNLELGLLKDPKDPNKRVRIDTKKDSFKDGDAFQLIRAVVKDTLIYSMDIEQGGEHSWVQKMFLLATQGNDQGIAAKQSIISAANILTSNYFGQIFDPSQPIAVQDGNRIHLGYYTDPAGNRRDLREIDHLAMLNMYGDTNMEMVDRFADTFDRVEEDMDLRLHYRAMILREAVGDIKVKGYADRINLNPVFMNALVSAAFQAGLTIDPSAMQAQFNASPRGNNFIGQFASSGFSEDIFKPRHTESTFAPGGFMGGGRNW